MEKCSCGEFSVREHFATEKCVAYLREKTSRLLTEVERLNADVNSRLDDLQKDIKKLKDFNRDHSYRNIRIG